MLPPPLLESNKIGTITSFIYEAIVIQSKYIYYIELYRIYAGCKGFKGCYQARISQYQSLYKNHHKANSLHILIK